MNPDTKLRIDPELTRTLLKHFLRDEIRKVGFEKAVIGPGLRGELHPAGHGVAAGLHLPRA